MKKNNLCSLSLKKHYLENNNNYIPEHINKRKSKYNKFNMKDILYSNIIENQKKNYIIENNKIKERKNLNLFENINTEDNNNYNNKFNIKNLLNNDSITKKSKKIPNIKIVNIKNLKSFLDKNIKFKSKSTKHRKVNSIKLIFNKKDKNNKSYRKNPSNTLLIEKIKYNLKEINDFKKRIKINNKKFNLKINSMKNNQIKSLKIKNKWKIISKIKYKINFNFHNI